MREVKSVLYAMLISALMSYGAQAKEGQLESEKPGSAEVNADGVQNIGRTAEGFTVGVWLSERKNILESWDPGKTAATIPVTSTVEREVPTYIAVFFTGQKENDKKQCEVAYDLVVRRPNGSSLAELHDAPGCNAQTQDNTLIHMGRQLLEISLPSDAAAGLYTVEATVKDGLADTRLDLKSSFTVYTYNPLPAYDFSVDYRPALAKKTQQDSFQAIEELGATKESAAGISLQRYAEINAHITNGEKIEAILKREKINQKTWDQVSENWGKSMAEQDDSFKVSFAYSYYFYASGIGKYPETGVEVAKAFLNRSHPQGKPPIAKENWLAIKEQVNQGIKKGEQLEQITARHDFTVYDWCVIDSWWSHSIL